MIDSAGVISSFLVCLKPDGSRPQGHLRYCRLIVWLVFRVALFPKFRAFVTNLLLGLAVLFGVYAVLEWQFLRLFPYLFPLNVVQKLDEPEGVWPVLQSSKRSFLPQGYVALVGDSYAMGMGDSMAASGIERQPRFHSAHTLQDISGRDVVSFGLPGSGSIRGLVGNPVGGLAYLRASVAADFPDPEWVVAYFYEGNDLTENWMYFEQTFLPDYPAEVYDNPDVFSAYIHSVALGRQHLYLAARHEPWQHQLRLYRFASRVVGEQLLGRKYYRRKYPGEFGLIYVPENRWQPRQDSETTNRAWVGGGVVPLPDNLQGPALDLSPEQRRHAVSSFAKALAWSRAHFAKAQFAVVYIPSVLSSYRLAGDVVEAQNYFSDTATRFSVADVQDAHTEIRDAVAAVCREQGVLFADATPDVQRAAAVQLLHGPGDWNHFNAQGYRVLGESVARQLPALLSP